MNSRPTPEERREVVLGLLPEGRVFRHARECSVFFAPEICGYVIDDCPFYARLYEPAGEGPNDHSYTIDAAELLGRYGYQDGTPLAVLIDALIAERTKSTMLLDFNSEDGE